MTATAMIQQHGVVVTVQRVIRSLDAGRSPVSSYANHMTARMFKQIKSGSESVRYDRESNRRIAVFYAKAGLDVRVQDRILHGSEVWDIFTVRQPGEFGSGTATGHLVIEAQETTP